jgi:hypothetical protein
VFPVDRGVPLGEHDLQFAVAVEITDRDAGPVPSGDDVLSRPLRRQRGRFAAVGLDRLTR